MIWSRNDFPEGAAGNTMGLFFPQTVNIAGWGGMSVQLELRFDTFDGAVNDTEGVYVDDFVVNANCP